MKVRAVEWWWPVKVEPEEEEVKIRGPAAWGFLWRLKTNSWTLRQDTPRKAPRKGNPGGRDLRRSRAGGSRRPRRSVPRPPLAPRTLPHSNFAPCRSPLLWTLLRVLPILVWAGAGVRGLGGHPGASRGRMGAGAGPMEISRVYPLLGPGFPPARLPQPGEFPRQNGRPSGHQVAGGQRSPSTLGRGGGGGKRSSSGMGGFVPYLLPLRPRWTAPRPIRPAPRPPVTPPPP